MRDETRNKQQIHNNITYHIDDDDDDDDTQIQNQIKM